VPRAVLVEAVAVVADGADSRDSCTTMILFKELRQNVPRGGARGAPLTGPFTREMYAVGGTQHAPAEDIIGGAAVSIVQRADATTAATFAVTPAGLLPAVERAWLGLRAGLPHMPPVPQPGELFMVQRAVATVGVPPGTVWQHTPAGYRSGKTPASVVPRCTQRFTPRTTPGPQAARRPQVHTASESTLLWDASRLQTLASGLVLCEVRVGVAAGFTPLHGAQRRLSAKCNAPPTAPPRTNPAWGSLSGAARHGGADAAFPVVHSLYQVRAAAMPLENHAGIRELPLSMVAAQRCRWPFP